MVRRLLSSDPHLAALLLGSMVLNSVLVSRLRKTKAEGEGSDNSHHNRNDYDDGYANSSG
jgi:hypothetical protein